MEAGSAAAADAGAISAWALFMTSATPTLIVCILAAVGAALAHKGVLDARGCQIVARMGFMVYTPALTFSKLTQAVSLGTIRHLWPLLANMTISIVVGLGLGLLVARLLRTPPQFRTHALVAIAFGNVGNLPLVFVSTLCHDKQAVFYRTLGPQCEQLGIAYTAFDIAAATLWQFTLGINLIRRSAAAAAAAAATLEGQGTGPGAVEGSTEAGLPVTAQLQKHPTVSDLLQGRRGSRPGSVSSSPRSAPSPQPGRQQLGGSPLRAGTGAMLPPASPYSSSAQQAQQAQQAGHMHVVELMPMEEAGPGAAAATAGWQQPHHRNTQHSQQEQQGQQHGEQRWHHHHQQQQQQHDDRWRHGSRAGSEIDEDDSAALLSGPGSKPDGGRGGIGAGAAGSRRSNWFARLAHALRQVDWGAAFPLPSQAAILGIVVGCIPPLKGLLFAPNPPLRVLAEAMETLGNGLIPVTLPLLGAVLYRGPGASRLPLRVTLGVLVTRLVLQPALLTALVVAALRLKLFVAPDAMFLLTMLLSNATPTAINMQTLCVLYNCGESEMSTILFWQYLASVLTLPALMRVFLAIIASNTS